VIPVPQFDAAVATDPGWKFKENQDAVLLGTQLGQGSFQHSVSGCTNLLAAVADGLAHAPCAARASRMVLEQLLALAGEGLTSRVPRAIQRHLASQAAGTRCEGMASTLAAMHLSPGRVRLVSVGDTRIYLWRNSSLLQVTTDHTIANRMVREGDLTQEEAARAGSLYSDLDSALVASEFDDMFEVFDTTASAMPGDCWLCVSDGITAALPDDEIADLLASLQHSPPDRIVAALLDRAKRNRASDDNLSAIAVRVAVNSP
jgi:serine/threonine protein phosphatase PrpC